MKSYTKDRGPLGLCGKISILSTDDVKINICVAVMASSRCYCAAALSEESEKLDWSISQLGHKNLKLDQERLDWGRLEKCL